jgi:hypothetical protein
MREGEHKLAPTTPAPHRPGTDALIALGADILATRIQARSQLGFRDLDGESSFASQAIVVSLHLLWIVVVLATPDANLKMLASGLLARDCPRDARSVVPIGALRSD